MDGATTRTHRPGKRHRGTAKVIARLGEGGGAFPTPFNIWLHNPRLAEGMEIIGTHIDRSPVLSEAEGEVAILSTAVFWNAPYVIANHRRSALKAGVPEALVAAIIESGARGIEGRLARSATRCATSSRAGVVDDARFARYEAELGRAVIAELLVTIGYFTSVSLAMTCTRCNPRKN
jgi:4-carboxymuconolactone decarboxylase